MSLSRLPVELTEQIIRHLAWCPSGQFSAARREYPQRLASYATISRSWQTLIERHTFHCIVLKSGQLHLAKRFVHPNRLCHVRIIYLDVVLPPRSVPGRSSSAEAAGDNRMFTRTIPDAFQLLRLWDSDLTQSPSVTLIIRIYHEQGPSQYIHNSDLSLPVLRDLTGVGRSSAITPLGLRDRLWVPKMITFINHLEIGTRGSGRAIRVDSTRRILKAFRCLEELTFRSGLTVHETHLDRAHAAMSIEAVPKSVRRLNYESGVLTTREWFISALNSFVYEKYTFETLPKLTWVERPNTPDLLSSAVRNTAQLSRLSFEGVIGLEFFCPDISEHSAAPQSWPYLEEVDLRLLPFLSSGVRLMECEKKVSRIHINERAMNLLLYNVAEAVTRMPKLKLFVLQFPCPSSSLAKLEVAVTLRLMIVSWNSRLPFHPSDAVMGLFRRVAEQSDRELEIRLEGAL